MKKFNKVLFIFICLFALVFSCSCGKDKSDNKSLKEAIDNKELQGFEESRESQEFQEPQDIGSIVDENNAVKIAFTYKDKAYGFRPNVQSYLIMGIDRFGEVKESEYNIGTGQCDAIYLLVLDHDNSKYTILQLNRDSMVEMNILGVFGDNVGTEFQQLALAHAYGDGKEGSCKNCVAAVSNLLKGISIDGYAALQFDALPILNDDIGGVKVHIEDDWSGVDDSLIQGSDVLLQGEHALLFVRARQNISDGENLSRMRRQSAYLNSFNQQLKTRLKQESNIINKIYYDLKPYMCTDLSAGVIANLAAKASMYDYKGIVSFNGINKLSNYMEFWIDDASLNETVIDLFCIEVAKAE